MWDVCFENSRVSRKARIFSDHFPLFLEAGSFLWGPSPFRFCNSWLVSSDSNQIIVETVSNSNFQGWAGFILHEQLRSVKLLVDYVQTKFLVKWPLLHLTKSILVSS